MSINFSFFTQTLLLFFVASLMGCATPMQSGKSGPIPVTPQSMTKGGQYEIVVNGSDENRQVSYVGQFTAFDGGSIKLENAIKRVEISSSPKLPLIGKLFLNKSVGGSKVDGPITIQREHIAEIFAEPVSQQAFRE